MQIIIICRRSAPESLLAGYTLRFLKLKTQEDWGNSCQHICRQKESILTDYHFFQDLFGTFSHFKAIHL